MTEGHTPDLTRAETAFAMRMGWHVERGLSIPDAAVAVLGDDARIADAFWRRGGSTYFPTPDERGHSRRAPDREGDLIASELSRQVYASLKARAIP